MMFAWGRCSSKHTPPAQGLRTHPALVKSRWDAPWTAEMSHSYSWTLSCSETINLQPFRHTTGIPGVRAGVWGRNSLLLLEAEAVICLQGAWHSLLVHQQVARPAERDLRCWLISKVARAGSQPPGVPRLREARGESMPRGGAVGTRARVLLCLRHLSLGGTPRNVR